MSEKTRQNFFKTINRVISNIQVATMNKKQIKERIAEFTRIHKTVGDDETKLLLVALFVEDVFGIVLSDDDICKENFGTHYAMERFVLDKLHLE